MLASAAPPEPTAVRPYTGLVTRAVALVIDALIIQTVAVVCGAVVGLLLNVFNAPDSVDTIVKAVGGACNLLWAGSYFVFFWSTTAQTPGARLMRFVVHSESGPQRLGVGRSIVRFIGLILATIPLFAGFWPVLFTKRRRGLPDWMAGSVVTDTDDALL